MISYSNEHQCSSAYLSNSPLSYFTKRSDTTRGSKDVSIFADQSIWKMQPKKKQFWHKWKYSNENGFRFRFWFCKIISVSLLRSFLWLRMFSYWSLWSTQAWRIVIWKLYSWKSGFIKSNVDFKRYQNYVFSKKYPPIQQPPSPQSSSLLPFSLTIFTSSIFEKLRTKMFTLTVVGSSENNWFKEMDYR